MAFEMNNTKPTGTGTGTEVDFDALNRYVVETAKLQERETLVGVVSMVVDLGEQDLPDAEVKFDGSPEDEEKIQAEMPDTYFKDGFDQDTRKPVRLKCWPQKPQQCVAFAIDFPEIMVDKGSFFGESNPLPLRLWQGGQFYVPTKGMVVGRPTPLKYTNLDKTRKTKIWSLAQNSLPYKMAVAAKIIKAGEPFLPERVDELLGKALQFTAQVFMKPGKEGKEYYTEYVNFAAGLGRGQTAPELPFEPSLVLFNKDNEDDAIKSLRAHVVNTIKGANNYEGSKIKAQIESVRGGSKSDSDDTGDSDDTPKQAPVEDKVVKTPAKAKPRAKAAEKPTPAQDYDNFDDDIPF